MFTHCAKILSTFDSDSNLRNLPGEMYLLEVTLWYSHSCSERLREEQNQYVTFVQDPSTQSFCDQKSQGANISMFSRNPIIQILLIF